MVLQKYVSILVLMELTLIRIEPMLFLWKSIEVSILVLMELTLIHEATSDFKSALVGFQSLF